MFSPRDVVVLFFHFKGIQNSLVRLCGCLVTCCSLLFSICQSWIHRSKFLWGPLQLPVPFHRLERRAFQAMLVSFSMLFLFRCWWNLSFYVKYLYSIWILHFLILIYELVFFFTKPPPRYSSVCACVYLLQFVLVFCGDCEQFSVYLTFSRINSTPMMEGRIRKVFIPQYVTFS